MPVRTAGPVAQDWEPVVLRAKQPAKAAAQRDPKAVNAALQAGAQVQVVKKSDAAKNQSGHGPLKDARKLEEQTEPGPLERVRTDVRLAIQKARLAKGLTQAQLAQAICERLPVVQEYESGKAIPSQQVLAKMEKALGVKLRGNLK